MRRVLKCDGILVEKMNPEGKGEEITPEDVREIKAYVEANRALTTPFDIVVNGKTAGLDQAQLQDQLLPWREAGATWWIEGLIEASEEQAAERIRQGSPRLD